MEFETIIGLEIHAQVKTASKIFCSCSTQFGAPPNSNTCPVCLGLPGALPVLNKKVVECAIKLGLATNATIRKTNQFARKNYFYPDLPKGYQTSQFDKPIVEKGHITIQVAEHTRTIGITRIHMEEDAGKLIHDEREPHSYVDINRAGTPLLEIVSEPDLRSPEEASAYLKKIHAIVRYLDICDGNMQEGSFRCDANISLRPVGETTLGTRTELKNMNSFKNVEKALKYEERRQRDLLLDGEDIVQETLLWDPDANKTVSMRGKEDAHDYRYFPCPDLVDLEIEESWINELRETLPELPDARKQRFIEQYALPAYDAEILTAERELADYFENAVQEGAAAKQVSNWIMTEVLRELKGESITSCKVTASQLAALLLLIDKGVISGKIAKGVFLDMLASGEDPQDIVEKKNLAQVSDAGALQAAVAEIIAANPQQVEEFRGGKTKLMGYFVGQLMKQTKGKANPALANKLFHEALSED